MDDHELKKAIQSLLNKGLIYCTLELRDGKLVEVYRPAKWLEGAS